MRSDGLTAPRSRSRTVVNPTLARAASTSWLHPRAARSPYSSHPSDPRKAACSPGATRPGRSPAAGRQGASRVAGGSARSKAATGARVTGGSPGNVTVMVRPPPPFRPPVIVPTSSSAAAPPRRAPQPQPVRPRDPVRPARRPPPTATQGEDPAPPHRMPGVLIVTVPHKHTIPAPGAAVELAEPAPMSGRCDRARSWRCTDLESSAQPAARRWPLRHARPDLRDGITVLRRLRADQHEHQHIHREPASEARRATVRVDGCRDTGRVGIRRPRGSGVAHRLILADVSATSPPSGLRASPPRSCSGLFRSCSGVSTRSGTALRRRSARVSARSCSGVLDF